MSPEQVRNREIDCRSDLFSLGVVFYEMLSGALPFKGELEPVMMYSIAHGDPKPLNMPESFLTDNLQALINLLLCKDPDQRIQSAAELISNLDQLKELSPSDVPSKQSKKPIAIMYFQDYTAGEEIGWLSKGIPHMLITSLEQSMFLNVVGYRRLDDILNQGGKGDADIIRRRVATDFAGRAGPATMIMGAVFKSGNSIGIDYQINDVASGRLVRAGRIIGDEAFGVADELGLEIGQELEIEETGGKVIDVTTHSLEAYRYYVEGTEYFNRGNYEAAARCFVKAIACDPTIAMAYFWMAGIIFVYLIMVALYNSFVYPFVVLFSIPLAVAGALLALALTMKSMNIFSILGIIMLVGLVGKNAILLADRTNQMRTQGLPILDALMESAQSRLRPIVMTTLTMIAAMMPVALSISPGAEWKSGLAWALVGGLSSSLFLTLLVVPVVYLNVERLRDTISAFFCRLFSRFAKSPCPRAATRKAIAFQEVIEGREA